MAIQKRNAHFQIKLLYRKVALDLEDRLHLAPQESGKTTGMHILTQAS